MNSVLSMILFALVACVLVAQQAAAQGKTCNLKEIDMCATNYYYDLKGVPTNERQMKKTCSSTRTFHKCIHAYLKRCMSRPLQETFGIVIDGVVQKFMLDCAKPANDPAKVEMYKYGRCINDKQKEVTAKCGDMGKEAIFFTLDQEFDKRIGSMCCNAKRTMDCTYDKTVEVCSRDHADYAKRFTATSDLVDSFCEHYDPKGPTCEGLLAPAGYISKEDPKSPLSRMINAFF